MKLKSNSIIFNISQTLVVHLFRNQFTHCSNRKHKKWNEPSPLLLTRCQRNEIKSRIKEENRYSSVHTSSLFILWADPLHPLGPPSFRMLVPPRKRRNIPIEANERSGIPRHIRGFWAWKASVEPLDAYCRWNMFDEGEKELTIFIAGCARPMKRKEENGWGKSRVQS